MTAFRPVEFVHGVNAPREIFLANVRTNATQRVPSLQSGRAVLVAGGPSAADHIEDIRSHAMAGWKVFCVNGAHDWLLKNCIQPDACVLMDAGEEVDCFVQQPVDSCRYYLASQTNPKLFDRLIWGGFQVILWHAHLGDEDGNNLIEALYPDPTILVGFNTVGLHSLSILCMLGIRKVRVYGMDSSHRESGDHAYDNSHQKPIIEQDFWFEGVKYMSTGTWASQAVTFGKAYAYFADAGMKIEVIGDGLLPHIARVAKERWLRCRAGEGVAPGGGRDIEGPHSEVGRGAGPAAPDEEAA